MSKYLVAFYNGTNETIKFVNTEHSGDDKTLPPSSMFTTAVHFNIPDNSDPEKYFDDHHMEIQNAAGAAIFSFWDDDDNEYIIKYCNGTNWKAGINTMPGYNPPGNETDVGIVLTGTPQQYQIKSCSVQLKV